MRGKLIACIGGILFAVGALLMASEGLANTSGAITAGSTPTPVEVYLPLVMRDYETSRPVPDGYPSWGAPIAISSLDEAIWVVNPDAGSVSVIDAGRLEKVAEVQVGQEPWSLVISPDGASVYVADRAAGALVVIDALSRTVRTAVRVGPEPGAVALSPTGAKAYVTLTSADQVAVVDIRLGKVIALIPVDPRPYAIAVTDDGDVEDDDEFVYVTHLTALPRPGGVEATDDGREGHVTVIAAGTNQIVNRMTLPPDVHGFPNLLTGIALTKTRAWVPAVRAAPDLPNTLTTTVFASVSSLDLIQGVEDPAARILLNDQENFGSPINNPVAAVPAPDGRTLYVVAAGSDLVEVVDVSNSSQPRLVKFLATGKNPRGIVLTRDGRRGYVMNYLSRSVTVLDLERLEPIAEIPVTAETLAPDLLRGNILLNNASYPRLSRNSWISCASCHPGGGSDGVTWMMPDGPRQTPALWNAGQTGPWHRSATLDELQDVEATIEMVQDGLGLAPGADPPLLGTPNAGRSADLDALAAFIARGIRAPAPPSSGDVARGRSLFQSAGCAACHGGPTWTSSALPGPAGTLDPDGNGMVDAVLRNVGTLNARDVRGATGFDPPSLLDVGLTAPYLHDASKPTLEAVLTSGHPDPLGNGNGLNSDEIASLAAFLRSIGPDTPPIGAP